MKVDRKTKVEKSPPAVKGGRRTASKTNGKHPLVAYEHIPIGIVEVSLDGKYMDVNQEFCRILGYSRQELLQLRLKDCTHEDDYAIDAKLYEQLIAKKIPFYRLEKRYLQKGGGDIWVELTRTLVCDSKGKPLYTVGVVLDISDRKDVERVLRDSVERLRLATGAAQMFMWEWDFQNQAYTLADDFEQVLGFSAGLLPRNKFETIWALSPEEDVRQISESFERAVENQSDLSTLPCRVINPENGQTVWLEVSAKIVYDAEGNPQRMFGVAQNITESKNIQDEIKVISRMPEENPNPVMRLRPDGKVLYANPASAALLEDWMQGVQITIPEELLQTITQAFTSGTKTEVEIGHQGKYFSFTVAPLVDSGYVNLYGKDITQRKQAEEKLRESEERFRTLANVMPSIVWTAAPDGTITYANDQWFHYVGITPEENATDWPELVLHPDDYERCVREWTHALETVPDEYRIEVRNRRYDGQYRWFLTRAVPVREASGKALAWYGVTTDIHERIEAEQRLTLLAEISEMLRNVEDPHDLMYAISEAIGEHLHVKRVLFNEIDLEHDREIVHRDYHSGLESVAGVHKISDYSSATSAEVAAGKTVVNVDSKTDLRTAADYERTYAITGERAYVVVPMMRHNRWVASLWVSDDSPRQWTSEEVSLLETIAERTWTVIEKLRINAELRESEERLRATLATTVVGFATLSTDMSFIEVNDAFCRIVGYSREELLGMNSAEVTHPDFIESTNQHVAQLLAGEIPSFVLEKLYIRKDSAQIWVQNSVSLMRDTDGKPHSLIMICQDVAERKFMEEQLRLREAELEDVINQTPFMLTRCTRDLRYRFVSRAYAEMIGRTPEELVGKPIVEVMGEEGLKTILPYVKEVLEGNPVEYESKVSFKGIGEPFLHVAYTPDRDEQGNVIGWFASIADISERKRSEQALRESEERYRFIVENTSDGIWWIELTKPMPISLSEDEQIDWYYKHAVIRQCNLGMAHMYGYDSIEDVVGLPVRVVMPRENPVNMQLSRQFIRSGYRLVDAESREKDRDGHELVFLNNMVGILEDDKLKGEWGTNRDITERKRAEEALRRNEKMFSTLVDAAPFGVYFIDSEFRLRSINKGAEAVFNGINPLIGRDFAEILRIIWEEPFATEAIERFRHTLRTGESFISPPMIEKRANIGEIEAYDWQIHRITLGDGTFGVVCYFYDLSEQKQMEATVRASEALYRAIARSIPGGGVYVVNKDFRYLVAEGPVTEAFRLTREMLEGHTVTEVFPEERGARMEERLRRTFAGETVSFETQFNGRVYWTQQAPLLDSIGHAIIVTIDITERKRAEESLRASELRYRNLFDLVPVAVYSCDAEGAIQEYNHRAVELWGREPDPYEKYCGSYKIFYPDGRLMPHAECPMARVLRGETLQAHEFEIIVEREDGRRRNVIAHPLLLGNEQDEITGAINCLYDITERKRAEEALRQSEERFARFMQHLPGLAWIKDMNGHYVYANAAAEKAFNTPREQLYGMTDEDIFASETAAQFKQNDERALMEAEGVQIVETLRHQDGILHHSLVTKFPIPGPDGHTTLIGGTAFDITERLRADEALRESEERFRALLNQATAGIVRKDADGRLIFVNQAFCNMLGRTEEELLGKTVWDFMHEEDIAENRRSYERLMLEGIPFKLERRLIRADGSVIWVDASVSPIMDAEGKPQSAVAVEVDITGRKQAEEALQQLNLQLEDRILSRTAKLRAVNQTLREEIAERKKIEEALRKSEAAARENEEKLSTLFELLPVGISFLDLQGQIIQLNPALANILKLSKEQLGDQSYRARKYIRANGTLMPPTEFANQRALTEGKTVYNMETGVLLEDGELVWTSVSAAPVNVGDVGAVVVTVDITESKRAERALQESRERLQILSQRLVEVQEEERRAIARELHDRVGQTLAALNINLIIINGQLGGKVEEQISTRLNDSMKLVAETIALVRDVMSNLRPSVLDDYGLEAAIESHLSQYMARYEIDAKFEKPSSPLPRLSPSIEMTFLRIAQEALMNIAKHAHAGHVTLRLQNEGNAVHMIIQDNGIGIESWSEANQPGSHGLTIMRERAEAFGGTLRLSSVPGNGTKVDVQIPVENTKPPQVQKERSS